MRDPNQTSALEKNQPTFLLLGLCITLLAVYGLFELKTDQSISKPIPENDNATHDINDVPRTFIKQQTKPKPIQDAKKPNKKSFSELFIEVPNQIQSDIYDEEPLDLIDDDLGREVAAITVNIEMLDKKPIFPGCEDILNEKERFDCFQAKMMAFVASNFKPCQSTFGVSKEKLFVMFTIDEFGVAGKTEVTRSSDACNTENVVRVIAKLPRMTPGMFMDKKVKTRFVLPINIQ